MAKAITTYVKGIKCDNEECGWKDPTVPYEDYPKYIDKPCPCCGANLLTRQDYLVTKRIIEISKLFGNIEVPEIKADPEYFKKSYIYDMIYEDLQLNDWLYNRDNPAFYQLSINAINDDGQRIRYNAMLGNILKKEFGEEEMMDFDEREEER